MNVSIDSDGNLRIEAEQAFEHYLLRKWCEDWHKHAVTLEVCTSIQGTPEGHQYHLIRADNGKENAG